MIPERFSPLLFAFLLSGQMSFLVSGVATFGALGFVDGFLLIWLRAWLVSWAIGFPAVLLARHTTQWMVARLVSSQDQL